MMLVQTSPSPTLRDALRHFSLRVADEIRNDVGIEQVTHQGSTGSGGKSRMGGKSSGSGARDANTANRDLGGAGSMINRSPSFRMMASSPQNSNSRGSRTARLRPFRKILT